MIITDNGGSGFEQAPVGTHLARCVKLIDIGTQRSEYQGQVGFKRQVIIGWELPGELIQSGEYAGEPFVLSGFYTASLNEKATLRTHLKNWRGRDFTEEELKQFDLRNILGKPCMLSVIHNDKQKARVGGVMAMPKGMPVPVQINQTIYFSLDEKPFNQAVFDSLSEGIRKMIMASAEYQQATTLAQYHAPVPAGDSFDDDIPF